MIARSGHLAPEGSPRWLWAMAIALGPVWMAFAILRMLSYTPDGWDDVISCGSAVHPLQGSFVALLLLQIPTALVAVAGLASRSRWHRPAILTASCGLAVFLAFTAWALGPSWPKPVYCTHFAAVDRTWL